MFKKTTVVTTKPTSPQWYVVDASQEILGRMSARIAQILMGKHKPTYTPHIDTGDFVIVLNASKLRITGGNKPTAFLFGSGFHMPVFYIDYAVVTGATLTGNSSKGLNFAVSTGLHF